MKAYVFKVVLLDSSPLIWRKFVVPADITFLKLHMTLQYVMGWTNSHLHKFSFEQIKTYFTNDIDDVEETRFLKEHYKNKLPNASDRSYPFVLRRLEREVKSSSHSKIDKFISVGDSFLYEYDFGDSWIHQVTLLEILTDYKYPYPRILEGEGDCPVEDVGGILGYENFLSIIYDLNHPQRSELTQWSNSQHWTEFSIRDSNAWMKHDLILKRKSNSKSKKIDLGDIIDNELTRLKIGQPAARALLSIGVVKLKDLTKINEKTVLDLHGVGPKAIRLLKEALEQKNMTFLKDSNIITH